jgi:hypothetical protein
MKHEYIIGWEVCVDGHRARWGTQAFTYVEDTHDAKSFIEDVISSVADSCYCETRNVRITGVWKL